MKENMKAKEYLYQLWNLDREIEIKLKVLEKTQAQIGIRAMPDPDTHVGRSGDTSDPVFDYVAKVTALQNQINRKIDRLIDLKAKIIGQIDGMENRTYRDLLMSRYVLMMTWEDVADSLGYEHVRQCHRVHGRALQEFEKKYLKCH